MKKLLALVMVLGIASLATAGVQIVPGLEYEVAGNRLTLTATENVNGFLLNLMADDGSLLDVSEVAPGFAAVNFGGEWNNAGYLPNGLLGVSASVGSAAGMSGAIYSVNFASSAQTITFLYAQYAESTINFSSGENAVVTGQTMIVPEPMTMGLLGLGGLFLARRKK